VLTDSKLKHQFQALKEENLDNIGAQLDLLPCKYFKCHTQKWKQQNRSQQLLQNYLDYGFKPHLCTLRSHNPAPRLYFCNGCFQSVHASELHPKLTGLVLF
jgi:hypothetical protein